VRELLIASQNPGKLTEMRALVSGLPFAVLSPTDLGLVDAPPETGATFLENAALKAKYYAARSGLMAVADDSGLSVEALDGGPGLYSARFGGEGATDEQRNLLLLERLVGIPPEKRGAYFTSAVVAVETGKIVFEAEEKVEGRIATRLSGPNGFGYDPLFYYPPLGCTFGELSPQEKARVSHPSRGG
jgi:XTP/dITP diphosphohydrolase